MEKHILYEALRSHDARFDGKFFVGVSSTGIYCRPVCRVRTPKEENCNFFMTAAAAERAGYRPCMKCRPELAPGNSTLEAGSDLAKTAAAEIEADCGSEESLSALAARLGCSDRHLRRVFEAEFHVSPLQYRQTCRLLLAKKLLTDSGLSVLDVAMASGFGSLRRFNTVFEREYKLTPSALRKQSAKKRNAENSFTVELGYRPPYRWREMLNFLGGRAIPGVEAVRDGSYMRTAKLGESTGWFAVTQRAEKNTLAVTASASLIPVLPQLLSKVRRLFDTDSDPQTVFEALESMKEIDEKLPICGLRVPGCFDAFEICVRAILGQQISVKSASSLAGRVAREFGVPINTEKEGLLLLFPEAKTIAEDKDAAEKLGSIGVIGARARAIKALAELFSGGAEPERERLLQIKGVGPWTADYVAMRAMGNTDVFLSTDHGVKSALSEHTKEDITALSEGWRPWRSYAVMNIWNL